MYLTTGEPSWLTRENEDGKPHLLIAKEISDR